MNIRTENGKPASEEAISNLESALGFSISGHFKAFLRTQDGAEPENNILHGNYNVGIDGFIPLDQILEERGYIENLPERAYPVAWAACGNIVYIDEGKGGSVFFWDHEDSDNVTELASDFDAFTNLLEPFDIDAIEMNPDQMISVTRRIV
jgi:hypothetical protein